MFFSMILQYHSENQKWLVDAAIRMICVFALDRFADFVSDQVDGCMHYIKQNSASVLVS